EAQIIASGALQAIRLAQSRLRNRYAQAWQERWNCSQVNQGDRAVALVAAQYRNHDVGGAQRRDLLRQVLVVGARGDEHGVSGLRRMDHVLNRLEGGLWPASVIGVVASSRIDIPLHGSHNIRSCQSRSRINPRSRPWSFALG